MGVEYEYDVGRGTLLMRVEYESQKPEALLTILERKTKREQGLHAKLELGILQLAYQPWNKFDTVWHHAKQTNNEWYDKQ